MLCQALTRIVAEHGWTGATPSRVAREAGIPPAEFYDHFRSLESCYLAVYDRTVDRASRTAARLVEARSGAPGSDNWREQLDAVISGLLLFFSLEPALARTCVVEVMSVGPAARARRDAALDDLARYVERLRLANGEPMPALAAEMIALGTTDVVYRRVLRGETEQLPALLPELRPVWAKSVQQHAGALAGAA